MKVKDMDAELNQKLINKYPSLYSKLRGKSFECGNGWYDLIDEMSQKIMNKLNENNITVINIDFVIVKEKFGTLNYQGFYHPSTIDIISEYENKSRYICELCGKPGKLIRNRSWMMTRCDDFIRAENLKNLLL